MSQQGHIYTRYNKPTHINVSKLYTAGISTMLHVTLKILHIPDAAVTIYIVCMYQQQDYIYNI